MKLKACISFSILYLLQGVSSFFQPCYSSTRQPQRIGHHDTMTTGIHFHSSPVRDGQKSLRDIYRLRSTVSPIRASDTSFNLADVLTSPYEVLRSRFRGLRIAYPWLKEMQGHIESWKTASMKFLRQTWWLCPMLLALVPCYSALCLGKCAQMPEWWQVVKMDTIRQSNDAALIIGGFLVSNIAYFASGVFLLTRFPVRSVKKRKSRFPLLKPTSFSMLGIWILLAGTVSTIFHSVQALGSHAISESLCYVDHAVAISAAFYFLKRCGFPSRRVLAIGIASLATLVYCHPAYAAIHSLWHFLSAATATQWALEGYEGVTKEKSLVPAGTSLIA